MARRKADHDRADPGPGASLRRSSLLREALTHPSTDLQDRGGARFGYERLEFLGDRVLGLAVAEWLLARFPTSRRGRWQSGTRPWSAARPWPRSPATSASATHLILSPGEAESGGRENEAILADACEAVIAALYLDGGFEAARDFIRNAFSDGDRP